MHNSIYNENQTKSFVKIIRSISKAQLIKNWAIDVNLFYGLVNDLTFDSYYFGIRREKIVLC